MRTIKRSDDRLSRDILLKGIVLNEDRLQFCIVNDLMVTADVWTKNRLNVNAVTSFQIW